MKVITRQINHKWHCSITHNGYDVLESADTLHEAQRLMRNRMFERGVHPQDLKFETPIFYTQPIKEQHSFGLKERPKGIDNL